MVDGGSVEYYYLHTAEPAVLFWGHSFFPCTLLDHFQVSIKEPL